MPGLIVFGFLFFVMIPISVILLILGLTTNNKIFGITLGLIWILPFFGIVSFVFLYWLNSPKDLKKKDYYGEYIVNRDYFKGRMTDWQYNSFRFEIKDNDSICFYVTDKEKVLRTYKGTISATDNYISERLILHMDSATHHIMSENPTTYRSAWDFYLVFHSPQFNNVFFKKGKWKPIEELN